MNSKSGINYAQRLQAIRPFVSFNYDLRQPLTSAAKAQITRYYTYIQKLTVRPHQVYRTRKKSNLSAVQRFAQHDPKSHPKLTVAFVPNAGSERMKISIDSKGRVHGVTGHIGVYEFPLDPERLIEEGRDYVEEVIAEGPRVKRFSVQAGEFEVPGAFSREFIVDEVVKLMERYGADKYDDSKRSSHFYGNWLHGLNGYTFHNQDDLIAYRETKRQKAKQTARAYVTQNRREKRIRDNPPGFWLNDDKRTAKRARPPQPAGWRQVNQREYYKAIYAQNYREIKDRKSS